MKTIKKQIIYISWSITTQMGLFAGIAKAELHFPALFVVT